MTYMGHWICSAIVYFESRSCVPFGQLGLLYLSRKWRGRHQVKSFPDCVMSPWTSNFPWGMCLCSGILPAVERRSRPWMPCCFQWFFGCRWRCLWSRLWLGAGSFKKILITRVEGQGGISGFLRFEAFTLFLGLSFAGDRLLASCFRS